ncbi:MAG: glycosyl transferase, group 1 [Acidobacteria bacterium]|nr:glycosyl transferase, group 1 [Acidobacteriota bacterium]
MSKPPRVLQITGAYYPEISAAGIQCRAVAAALAGRAVFSVLATAVDSGLPRAANVDDVTVYRLPVDVTSAASKAAASLRLAARLITIRSAFDLIHIHGVSQKNLAATAIARLLGKPIVVTLHTAGQDDPAAVKARSRAAYATLTAADLVVGVSPYITTRYLEAGLPSDRYRLIPNGIDTSRFYPATPGERLAIRRTLGWPDQPVIVFVGFFSRDKRPDLLFRAWQQLLLAGTRATLVYVGATHSPYFEVDRTLEQTLRAAAAALGRADDIRFTGSVDDVETYLRAADVFALPSIRETQSMALMEAMACGVPSVASRLEGATDAFVVDGVNGRLVRPDDEDALAAALQALLADPDAAHAIGARGRETIVERFAIDPIAARWLETYQHVLGAPARRRVA